MVSRRSNTKRTLRIYENKVGARLMSACSANEANSAQRVLLIALPTSCAALSLTRTESPSPRPPLPAAAPVPPASPSAPALSDARPPAIWPYHMTRVVEVTGWQATETFQLSVDPAFAKAGYSSVPDAVFCASFKSTCSKKLQSGDRLTEEAKEVEPTILRVSSRRGRWRGGRRSEVAQA